MPQTVSIAHAKNHLPALVHAVEAGGPVHLTRRGALVAVLLSADDYERMNAGPSQSLGGAFLRWRAETGGLDVPADFTDQLRDRDPGREVDFDAALSA